MHEESRANQIYTELREQIIGGEITSNDIITEKDLASKYGVSKTPIREALHRLCQEGYLKSYPRKGYMVNEISAQDCSYIQQLRYYIESSTISRVIDTVDDEPIRELYKIVEEAYEKKPKEKNPYNAVNTRFHLELAALCDNPYVHDVLEQYVSSITRVVIKYPTMSRLQEREYHREILDAILERDKNRAIDILYHDLSDVFPFER